MASAIKRLAGETVIYGMSTILGRMINFFFVTYYTRVLTTQDYGSYSEIMSYIAVFQVILPLGLETGCFKFANSCKQEGKDDSYPFSISFIVVGLLSLLFFTAIVLFSNSISNIMGYPGYKTMVIYTGGILVLDAITAVLFARLRYWQKALKFATIKTIKIISELGFNLLLFLVAPAWMAAHPGSLLEFFIPATPDFSYIIFAVFLSCILCAALLATEFIKIKIQWNNKLMKQMLFYSLPLMVSYLPGTINESLDRILFRFFAPEGSVWRSDLGIYQAAVKLAVIMNLFIQMFRYAAEPFFFARAKDKGSKELYATVNEYFTAFCMLIFVGILLNIDLISLLLGENFRSGVGTVPFMLISYMVLGLLFNVSMWYKLSGLTKYAITITLLGLAVTTVINVLFMPKFSYWASVAAHVGSGLAMLVYSVWLGNRHYRIPYDWKKICEYIFAGIAIYIGFKLLQDLSGSIFLRILIGTIGILLYIAFAGKRSGLLETFLKRKGIH